MPDRPERIQDPWAMTPDQLKNFLETGGISKEAAEDLYREWERLYPEITKWWDRFKREGGTP